MRLIRMIGLSAIAALAAMAFVSAGSASADVMCLEAHKSPCPAGQIWTGPVQGKSINEKLELGVATLLAGSFEIKCHSTFLAQNLASLGNHKGILGLIHHLAFTGCEGSCKEVEGGLTKNLPYHVLGLATPGHLVVSAHNGGGKPLANLAGCTVFNVLCSYQIEAASALLSIKLDEAIANKVPLIRHAGSGLCPEKGAWDAIYLVETDLEATPRPLYLSLTS